MSQADEHLQKDIGDSIAMFRTANEQLAITADILAPVCANGEAAKRIAGIAIVDSYSAYKQRMTLHFAQNILNP